MGVHFIIPPSLCEDISYVQTPIYHTFSIQIIHRSPKYLLTSVNERQEFYNNLLKLEEHVKLIPSSMEMRHHARKIPGIILLDQIAQDITKTARPTSYFHIKPGRTLASYQGDKYVFKRSHSAGSQHVKMPKANMDLSATIDERFNEKDEPRWFIQEKVPLLEKFECRVSICLKHPENKVLFRKWTRHDPKNRDMWNVDEIGSLIDISTLQ